MGRIRKNILEDGINEEDLKILRLIGEDLARDTPDPKNPRKPKKGKLSTSQIRKFFGEIKRIQADFENCRQDILLLDPKIAYALGRNKAERKQATKIEDFYDEVSPLLLQIGQDRRKFRHFVNVIEAMVAYHKAAGGE